MIFIWIIAIAGLCCIAEAFFKSGFYLPKNTLAWRHKYRIMMLVIGVVLIAVAIILALL